MLWTVSFKNWGLVVFVCDHSALWAVLWPSLSGDWLLCTHLFMDLIALYNTLQKLITPEPHTRLSHACAQLPWLSSPPRWEQLPQHRNAATLRSVSLGNEGKRNTDDGSFCVEHIAINFTWRRINNALVRACARVSGVMSQSRLDTDSLSQHSLLLLLAARPPVFLR